MTGGIVHDFKNILVVTGANIKLARKHGADERDIVAGEQALERGERLTAQLLSFAKRQELNPSLEDANALLKSLEPMIKQAAGPGTVVSYELDPSIPPCIVDRAQFDAAIINLVMNAAQSMKSGSISIATQPVSVRDRHDHGLKPGHYVAVRVTDSGCGIAPAELKRVFEPSTRPRTPAPGLASHKSMRSCTTSMVMRGSQARSMPAPPSSCCFRARNRASRPAPLRTASFVGT